MSAHEKSIVLLVVLVDVFLRSAMAVRVPGRRVGIMTGSWCPAASNGVIAELFRYLCLESLNVLYLAIESGRFW
jgi:hypothetical protein